MLNDCGKELLKPWMSVQNVVLIGSVIFAIALFKPSSSELASWVQAVGSIAAILGAFHLGNLQHKRQMLQRAEDAIHKKSEAKKLMLRLSENTFMHLSDLHGSLVRSMADFGNPSLFTYVVEGKDLRWAHLMEALQSADVREFDEIQTLLLIDLKVGCSFAMRVCERLEDWNSLSENERLLTLQVEHHKSRAEIAFKLFSPLKPAV